MKQRKTIEVVAAIIIHEGKLFATQRGYGEWKDWWEFPGGKIEEGESPEEALCREIREELGCEIAVGELLTTIEYASPAIPYTTLSPLHMIATFLVSASFNAISTLSFSFVIGVDKNVLSPKYFLSSSTYTV